MAYTGLIKFHYAILEEDVEGGATTYGTPKPMGAAISINETPSTSTSTLYAENGAAETGTANGATTAEVGVKELTQEVLADLLGQKLNEDGVRMQGRNDKAPYVALGFQMTGESENDAFVWLLKGKFGRPNTTAATKGESVTFNTPTISATFVDRKSDGEHKASLVQNKTNKTITDAWFTKVYDPTPVV